MHQLLLVEFSNLYTDSELCAPSSSFLFKLMFVVSLEASEGETVEFSQIPSETSALTTEFAKPATD